MADNWFSTSVQQSLFQFSADRTLLVIKQAMAQRMQEDLNKLNVKYDGKQANAIMDQASHLGDQKIELAQWLTSMDGIGSQMNDARTYLLQMKAALAVDTPNPESFDLYYQALNSGLSNERFDETSLVKNPSNHRGSWSEPTTMLSADGLSATLPHHYLGNDYAIELDGGGGLLQQDLKGTLTGGGHTITSAHLKLVSRTDDRVEFQDVTDPANPVTYQGTLKRGGLGVLPAWLYGDLSNPTVKATAQDDLKTAFKKLARYELDFGRAQSQLTDMDATLGTRVETLNAEYTKVASADADAKEAEKQALLARFELASNTLALTSGNQSGFIQQMFNTKPPTKKTLQDALFSAAGF